jgi:TonB family protein
MGVFSSIAASLFIAATMQGAADVNDIPAEPVRRRAPDFPAACTPAEGEAIEPQTVVVLFDVTKDGSPENVRVVETTDSCFDETAVAAVRGWKYKPRLVDGFVRPQEDLEASFTFVFKEPTQAEDFDARPLLRVPPRYPDQCQWRADGSESVFVEFDISVEGVPENIRTIESTNPCFNGAAKNAVKKWRYHPKTIAGKPAVRKGVVTQITFQLSEGAREPQWKYRRALKARLNRVRRSIRRGEDPQESLLKLKEIEDEFGDDFSKYEMMQFYYLRGVVRIAAGDYPGALDDMRVVQGTGMAGEDSERVEKTIAQLEAAIAAEGSGAGEEDAGAEQPQ